MGDMDRTVGMDLNTGDKEWHALLRNMDMRD